jgi:hypothetical protein
MHYRVNVSFSAHVQVQARVSFSVRVRFHSYFGVPFYLPLDLQALANFYLNVCFHGHFRAHLPLHGHVRL